MAYKGKLTDYGFKLETPKPAVLIFHCAAGGWLHVCGTDDVYELNELEYKKILEEQDYSFILEQEGENV